MMTSRKACLDLLERNIGSGNQIVEALLFHKRSIIINDRCATYSRSSDRMPKEEIKVSCSR